MRLGLKLPRITKVVRVAGTRLSFASFALCSWLALAAVAQAYPATAVMKRGIDAERMYQFGDIDSINLFNGNLNLRMPLGQSYPVSAGVSYGLVLSYNSSAWDYVPNTTVPPATVRAYPDRLSNAGMGWRVTLGTLVAPPDELNKSPHWIYLSPDGGDHVFFSGYTSDCANQTCYTKDNSFLRLSWSSSQPVITFPDGVRHVFEPDPASNGSRWRLEMILGTFASWNDPDVEIEYSSCSSPCSSQWTIRDRHLRQQVVSFVADPSNAYRDLVDSISLSIFGGGTATYYFHYVPRTYGAPCTRSDIANVSIQVPLLDTVTLPDGTVYRMTYDPTDCASYGSLRKLTLPTGGEIAWDYAGREMPVTACYYGDPWAHYVPAVSRRSFLNSNGTVLGAWTYYSEPSDPIPSIPQELEEICDPISGGPSEELKVWVTTPLNDVTIHYFSAYPGVPTITGEGPTDFLAGEQGLPFSRFHPEDPAAAQPRFLSTEVLDYDEVTGTYPSAPIRRQYVRYERDSQCQVADTSCLNDNQRLASQSTVFLDDPACTWPPVEGQTNCQGTWMESSEYDGFGHYRRTMANASFGPGGPRTTFTNFTPDPATWLLNTFTEQWKSQGSSTESRTFVFDPATGFLRCERRRLNPQGDGAKDVVVRYEPDPFGFPATELWYGGDQALFQAPADCDPDGATPRYIYSHEYETGVRKKTTTQVDGVPLTLLDLSIDGATGLPSASRDSAGLQTTLTYDWRGLLASETPPGAATTTYTFCPRGVSGACGGDTSSTRLLASVAAQSETLEEERTTLDSMGRIKKRERRNPAAGWDMTETRYNAAGWKEFQSEWGDGSTSSGTTYSEYDPFGRPGKVTKADGSTTNYIYTAESQTRIITRVWNGKAPEPAKGAQFYDRDGRLFVVKEPNGTRTRYHYDVSGRLISVAQNIGQSTTQHRKFTYDGRGFLTSATHPESGTTTYLYDARGNVIRSVAAGNTLNYKYDDAGRLTKVVAPPSDSNPAGAVLKEFVFGADASKGRVVDEFAYNWRPAGSPAVCTNFKVAEHYNYNATSGLVDSKTTSLSQGAANYESFSQSYTYDGAGRIKTLTYPCLAGCSSGERTVRTNYTYGRPTSITNFTSSISYNPNRTVASVLHSNGVVDLQSADPHGLPRPQSISAKLNGNFIWAQQDYTYDDSGNVKSIGNTSYSYDALSRLVSVTIPGVTPFPYQKYNYNVFGNLTRVSRGTVDAEGKPTISEYVNYTPVATTNRLSCDECYNDRGDLLSYQGSIYTWDRFDNLATVYTGSEAWTHLYDANNERIWSWRTAPSRLDTYALRDLGGKLLRDYKKENSAYSFEDYIYREGQLLASVDSSNVTRHFHLDHLGTVRRITSAAGAVTTHDIWPYGEEYTAQTDGQQMRFTGHERDLGVLSSNADDLDYMHARHYRPLFGRFLSPDKLGGKPKEPQSWNRYVYALSSPLNFVDPDGEAPVYVTNTFSSKEFFDTRVKDFLSYHSRLFDIDRGTATVANFKQGLADASGVSIYMGHSDFGSGLKFSGSSGFVTVTGFEVKNTILCVAACNSAALVGKLTPREGQTFVGVTSNSTLLGAMGSVRAGDLSYISTQIVAGLKDGKSIDQVVTALNAFFAERAKQDPSYKVTLTVFAGAKK